MFRNIRQRIFFLLLILVLLAVFLPGNAFAVTPCAECGSVNEADVIASGALGNVTPVNTPSLGVDIPGAPWSLCGICSTVTVGGGGAFTPNNTNTLSQGPFPTAILSDIARIIFTEPITAGASLHDLFHGLGVLEEIRNIDFIDTAATQNMRRMFFNTHNLAGPLDLSMWNTGNATNMYRMFAHSGIDSLNLGGSFNNPGQVTNMGSMFWEASNLRTIGDVSSWDTGNVTRMSRMFEGANQLLQLHIDNWNTGNVALMYNMFHNASSLSDLSIRDWNVEHVVRMDNMFRGAAGLRELDLSGWNTASLAQAQNMFQNLPNVTTLDLSGFQPSGVINRTNMFSNIMADPTPLRVLTLGPGWQWNAFQSPALGNPPNDADYLGLWQRVDGGTITAPRGPTATAAALFDNSFSPAEIAGVWVWAPRVSPLERQAYLIGRPDGLIYPNDNIRRAEVATIFFRLITDDMRADYWTQENPFPDVVLAEWFNNAVSTTANAGIFIGMPDGSFAPNRSITRAELATAVVRFMDMMVDVLGLENSFDDIDGHWAAGYINAAAVSGWVQGPHGLGGAFYPDRPITRAETAAIMNRIFGRLQESPADLLPDMLTWPDNRNETSWYYLYIQSASNSYTFEWKPGGRYEGWITIIEPRDWAVLERPDSRPEDIFLP